MSESDPQHTDHPLGRRWAYTAALLAAAVLVFTFIVKGCKVLELFGLDCGDKSPVVQISPRNAPGTGQCLEFAFDQLPSDFALGAVRLEIVATEGPTPFAGDQSAEITKVLRNHTLPIQVFFTKDPIEFSARVQATRDNDAIYLDFCPSLERKAIKGRLTVKASFMRPSGADVNGLEIRYAGGKDTATFEVSNPNNLEIDMQSAETQILERK